MSKQALSYHEFATRKAHNGNFDDVADVKKHFNEHQQKSWFDSTLIEYRQYLTESFPEMTLRQAQELTAKAPANV